MLSLIKDLIGCLIKDLIGFLMGGVPEASQAHSLKAPTTALQCEDTKEVPDDFWWWERSDRDASRDRNVFSKSALRVPLPSASRTGRPLKILALHGRGSNNDITSIQLSSLKCSSRCVADLLAAPHSASPQNSVFRMFSERPFHEWGSDTDTIRGVLAYIEKHGPYDGLYGFSQGAAVVTALSKPGAAEALGSERTWRFVICACGVPPPGEVKVDLPSLQIIGAADWCISASRALAGVYDDPTVLEHPGGHELPLKLRGNAHFQAGLDVFFDCMLAL